MSGDQQDPAGSAAATEHHDRLPAAPPDDDPRLARRALAAARAEAKRKGQATRRSRDDTPRPDTGVRSAAGPDDRDPQPLSRAVDRLITDRGWQTPAAIGGVVARWAEIVGTDVAAHCEPRSYDDGVLTIATDSTAWATQMRLLASELVRRLNSELGHRTVTKINVRGPSRPSWSAGRRSVRGRGPRDTYG